MGEDGLGNSMKEFMHMAMEWEGKCNYWNKQGHCDVPGNTQYRECKGMPSENCNIDDPKYNDKASYKPEK